MMGRGNGCVQETTLPSRRHYTVGLRRLHATQEKHSPLTPSPVGTRAGVTDSIQRTAAQALGRAS